MRLVAVYVLYYFFFFKQKTAYEMRISDWSSDVCSSDLGLHKAPLAPDTRGRDGARLDEIAHRVGMNLEQPRGFYDGQDMLAHLAHRSAPSAPPHQPRRRSEEHTSELQSLMRTSYAVLCLQQRTNTADTTETDHPLHT